MNKYLVYKPKKEQEINIYVAAQVSLEEYNKDIDEAMAEVARGESVLHEEVVKMAKNW